MQRKSVCLTERRLVMHIASLALMISLKSNGYVCCRQAQLRAHQSLPKEGERILTAFLRACDENEDDCRQSAKKSRERDVVLQQVFAHDETPPQQPPVAERSILPYFSMSPTASARTQLPLPSIKPSANPSEHNIHPSSVPLIASTVEKRAEISSGLPSSDSSSAGTNGVWENFNVSLLLISGAPPITGSPAIGSASNTNTSSTLLFQNYIGTESTLGNEGGDSHTTNMTFHTESPTVTGGPWLSFLNSSIYPTATPIAEGLTGMHSESSLDNDSSSVGESGVWAGFNATGTTSNCTVDRTGTYGSVAGNADDLGFFYQVETFGDVSLASVNDDIVPLIETEISNLLLPELFASQCASVEGLRDLNKFREKQEATGFSSSPADFILRGVRCIGNQDSYKNVCVVVEGRATIFSGTNTNTEALLAASRTSIREAMDDGVFNHLHGSIVGVKFRSGTVQQFEQSTAGTGSGFEQAIIENPPTYAWILICFFFGVINACFCCANRYNRRRWQTRQKRTEDVGEEYYDDGKYFLDDSWAQVCMAPTMLVPTKGRSSAKNIIDMFSGRAGETSFPDEFQNDNQ